MPIEQDQDDEDNNENEDINNGDFNLYFGECFSYFKKSKKPVLILGTGDVGQIDIRVFSDKEKKGQQTNLAYKQALTQLSLKQLPIGAINLPSSVCYLINKSKVGSPWKYRKLFNEQNLSVFDPFKKERALLRSPPTTKIENFTLLKSWTENEYVSAQEALENVSQFKRLGQAFSPEYYFGINYKSNSICLYRGTLIVGKVNQKNKVVELKPTATPLKESLDEFGLITKELIR